MLTSERISLSGLSRGNLEALTERLLAQNAALKQAIAEMRAEVAKLKGVRGRPAFKPSSMDKSTEPKPARVGMKRGTKRYKTEWLAVHEERLL